MDVTQQHLMPPPPATMMNLPPMPPPPPEEDARNIIDRLAEFVAKNGVEFEDRTREKQYGNPRFAFLFGGEHSEYYRFRVMHEIRRLNEPSGGGASAMMAPPVPVVAPPPRPALDVNATLAEIASLTQQIADSESNLRAQYDSIEMQREAQLASAIELAESSKISSICEQVALDVQPLSVMLDQLSGHCSKDVISSSKKWIFEKCTTDRLREAILMYLLYRVKEPRATEQFKLHILYLINDWAHHCQRKKLDAIRQMLSRYVPQLYAFTAQEVKDPSLNEKLEKLVGVWEGHKYFDDGCYKQLRNPLLIYQNWKNAQQAEYAKKSAEIQAQLLATYSGYEQQHQEFSAHVRGQIALLQQQIEAERLAAQGGPPPPIATVPPASVITTQPPPGTQPMNRRERRSRFDQRSAGAPSGATIAAPPGGQPPNFPAPATTAGPPPVNEDYGRFFAAPPPGQTSCPSPRDVYHARPDDADDTTFMYYDEEEYGNGSTNTEEDSRVDEEDSRSDAREHRSRFAPQSSQSQPGGPFRNGPPPPSLFDDTALIPNCPYFDLPAGMMLPLIEMDDILYKAVPVSKLRLPPPIPPSDRLLRAIEMFYSLPTPDNPRDSEGWERMGLFEYYQKKNDIRRRLEEKLKEEGKTIEDAIENVYVEEKEEENEGRRKSRHSPSKGRHRSASSSSSSSGRSRSSSRSSERKRRRRRRRSSSHSRGSSSSSSSRSRSRNGRHSTRRSRSQSPRRRRHSSSPEASAESRPAFGGGAPRRTSRSPTPTFVLPTGPPPRLSAINKGAQLLAKMGWQGGGLGTDNQGIEEPISGGEVRDRLDQYRGVGSKPDAFEDYRRQMSGYHKSRRRAALDS